MTLEKPPLFESRKEFGIVMALLLGILLVRLTFLYFEYREFVSKPFYYTNATVLLQYSKKKKSKSYVVLKLQNAEGKKFYTTAHLFRDLTGKMVRVKMFPDERISFADYLGTFYIKTILKVVGDTPDTKKRELLTAIAAQHKSPDMIVFYQAIFLATPVSKTLREAISGLGVSHLVALSGFHLTILWGLIYGLLSLLYRPAQQRWFPYRFMLLDLGVVTLGVLGFYLWFVDFPPSLVRSYAMLSIAWMMLLLGMELISFEFLGFVVMLLLALFPELVASLGFWFSVVGVYYIYLVLYWSQESGAWLHNKWVISLISIPVGIYLLMLPVVHGVFGMTSGWQLLSPLLSLLFTIFYPLVIGLHMIGMGGALDSGLLRLFALPSEYQEHILPLWVLAGYGLLSIGAMWSRILFWMTLGSSLLYLGYLLLFV